MSDFLAQLARLKVGDVVRVIDTARVTDVTTCGTVTLADVETGKAWVPWSAGSTRIEMVKKAAPEAKAGDILTGQEIRERQWKQGTVIQCLRHGGLSPLLLSAYGKWIGSHREEFDFDLLVEDADFKLLHVA